MFYESTYNGFFFAQMEHNWDANIEVLIRWTSRSPIFANVDRAQPVQFDYVYL